jgi:hypothetical protein
MKRAQAEMFAQPAKPAAIVRTRSPKRGPSPSPRPWRCSLIAVDTAENSGWAFWSSGTLHSSGEIDTSDGSALLKCVRSGAWLAKEFTEGPLVLVLEAPYGGPKHAGQVATLVALGRAQERWLRAWKDAGEARARVVMVQPQTWRCALFGSVRGMKRAELHKLEDLNAQAIMGVHAHVAALGADEAAAICIGQWASYAAAVGEVIGKKARAASMAAWREAK